MPFIRGISFDGYGFHEASLWEAWNDASQGCFYDDLVVLVLEDRLGFGSIAVVNLRDGKGTVYCLAEIYRPLETKIHSGGQPADLSADLGDEAGNQEPMTNAAAKVFDAGKAIIKMHRIVVFAEVRKGERILFREGA